MNGDGQSSTRTPARTRSRASFPASPSADGRSSSAIDSNFNTDTGTIIVLPEPGAAASCDSELSLGVLRIRAACIRRAGDVDHGRAGWSRARPRAAGTIYAIGLNGLTLVTHDPRARVRFDRAAAEIVGDGRSPGRADPQRAGWRHHSGTSRPTTASPGRCRPVWPRGAPVARSSRSRSAARPLTRAEHDSDHQPCARCRAASRSPAARLSGSTPGRSRRRWTSTSRVEHLDHRPSPGACACARASCSGASSRLDRLRGRGADDRPALGASARVRVPAAGARRAAARRRAVGRRAGDQPPNRRRSASRAGCASSTAGSTTPAPRSRSNPGILDLRRRLPEPLRRRLRHRPVPVRRRPGRIVRIPPADQRQLGLRRLRRRDQGAARRRRGRCSRPASSRTSTRSSGATATSASGGGSASPISRSESRSFTLFGA